MKFQPILAALAIVAILAIFPISAFAFRRAQRTLVQVPFDGGLSLLVAAGVGYAAKKGYHTRKKNKNSEGQSI